MWQDLVLGIGAWIFLAAIIPSIIHPSAKAPFSTSVLNTAVLATFSVTYWSLDLWGACASNTALTLGWAVLTMQRYRMNRRNGTPLFSLPTVPHWLTVARNDLCGTS